MEGGNDGLTPLRARVQHHRDTSSARHRPRPIVAAYHFLPVQPRQTLNRTIAPDHGRQRWQRLTGRNRALAGSWVPTVGSVTMPDYRFQLADRHGFAPDEEPMPFPNDPAAMIAAVEGARSLIAADVQSGMIDLRPALVVTEGRRIVGMVKFADVVVIVDERTPVGATMLTARPLCS